MTRNATTALAVCVVLLGTAIESRADCQYVRGSIAETRISLGTEPTRLLGTVTGVLNGAVTVTLLSLPPNGVRSLDIFVTKSGDDAAAPLRSCQSARPAFREIPVRSLPVARQPAHPRPGWCSSCSCFRHETAGMSE